MFQYKVLNLEFSFFSSKIKQDELESKLNDLGREGWELTTSLETNSSQGRTNQAVLILKKRS